MAESTILQERLKETFNGESQETTAKKLNLVQSSISKILKGDQRPSSDTLCAISKKYGVSVDWLLGLKEEKDVSPIDLKAMDYRQAFIVLDKLYETNSISFQRVSEKIINIENNDSDIDDLNEDADTDETSTLGMNYDILQINDPIISFMLRRRSMLLGIDRSIFEDWCRDHLGEYKNIPIMNADEEMQSYFAQQQTGRYSDGDWVATVKEYINKKEKCKDE